MLKRLQEEMNLALKNRETERLSVIRMLIADVKNEAFKEGKKRTSEEVILAYYKKLSKVKEDFAERTDFAATIEKELSVISEFIPKMMTKDEIIDFIKANVTEVSMKTVMPLLKGKANGKTIQEIVTTWVS